MHCAKNQRDPDKNSSFCLQCKSILREKKANKEEIVQCNESNKKRCVSTIEVKHKRYIDLQVIIFFQEIHILS